MGISKDFLKVTVTDKAHSVAVIGNGTKDISDIEYFQKKGLKVTAFDYVDIPIKETSNFTFVKGDFNTTCKNYQNSFDIVWACHVLEHQRNVGVFLDNIHETLSENGILYICVPPYKPNIVGGHLTVWNMGLLMYNLVLAHYDVRNGKFKKDGYNIFGAVEKSKQNLPNLIYDCGDIEALAEHWNKKLPLKQNINGDISSANWE
jgi:SAM-dependent methyltransferase